MAKLAAGEANDLASTTLLATDKRVLMVCHGEVMWAFRVRLERMSQETYRELDRQRARKQPRDNSVLDL